MIKLIRVTSSTKPMGKVSYNGFFDDGTSKLLRTSFREYRSVAQLAPADGQPSWVKSGQEEFLFSAKPSVALGRAQHPRLVASVQVEVK
jgi:hypothetical protein